MQSYLGERNTLARERKSFVSEHKIIETINQTDLAPPLTTIVFIFLTMVVNEICLVTDILPNIFPCVQQNEEIHTGLELLEGEKKMTEFSFLGELSL